MGLNMYLDLLNLKFYQLFCIEMEEVTKKGKNYNLFF